MSRDRGAAIVEYALILPVAIMLGVSGLFFALAMADEIRLQHAVSEAVYLLEDEAGYLIESAGGEMECFWKGTGPGGCFDDGIDHLTRVQVVAVGRTWHPPMFGSVTPRAEATAVDMHAP